ncbi:A/G-specific adenine glycosylase [Methanococcus maripaludis]|uniref:A/G-specific adenine glycosylase n=1 Tax=Methanococcus maripaludis TaxID=39152 RepID=A0A7J9NPE9_METMI|nr:A/G-specific adenine glycosylase [Methanococcus maripaludis]MBA2840872.1 A/G-specific adenine glycosylase [Methanococcus maripaludis]
MSNYNKIPEVTEIILKWYSKNSREFPWRYTSDPYKVFVSEILLQRTLAAKVIPTFLKIIKKYPSVNELAKSDINELKKYFEDIGLFYRAELLKNISKQISIEFNGKIPEKREDLRKIKGIGDYICNSILCFGYGKRYQIVDTNVVRLYSRLFSFVSTKKDIERDPKLWELAELVLPEKNYVNYNYAILDFAALICKSKHPQCSECPLNKYCGYLNKIT